MVRPSGPGAPGPWADPVDGSRSPKACALADGFGLPSKLYAQVSFHGMAIVGVIAIARADWPWLLPYLVLYGYGVPGIVMRHIVCPRCPHLFLHDDCLQFPPKLTRWLVKRPQATPMPAAQVGAFSLIFLLLPTYPIYWLFRQPFLLIVFAICAVAWYLGQWLYFCKRCRTTTCPFNRTRGWSMR